MVEIRPRGGADVWDQEPAGAILRADVFAPASAALARVWTGAAWVVGTVHVWNGSAWLAGTVRRWLGSVWS